MFTLLTEMRAHASWHACSAGRKCFVMKLLFAGQLVKCLLSRLANRKLSVQIVGERQHTIGPYPMPESMGKPSYIYIYIHIHIQAY